MPIFTHNVSPEDVLDVLPADTVGVTANSQGLNTGHITKFIERGAGMVGAQLKRNGMGPESLEEYGAQVARDAVIKYAVVECLKRLGASDTKIAAEVQEWNRMLTMLKTEPQSLGASHEGTQTWSSNSTSAERKFGSKSWGGW